MGLSVDYQNLLHFRNCLLQAIINNMDPHALNGNMELIKYLIQNYPELKKGQSRKNSSGNRETALYLAQDNADIVNLLQN